MDILYIIWGIWLLIFIYLLTLLRKVVPTNEVHVVQKWKKSIPYWRWSNSGNVYLAWPSWVPVFWVSVTKLPLSIFDLQLSNYKAYDIWKVPFQVDITAFFEIKNPELAAQKVLTITELTNQLNETLKWVVRKILASKDIVEIMESRAEIKNEFYNEVFEAVKAWWVDLKNVEFMDIRDWDWSEVVTNIMLKKRSLIEAESREEVAINKRNAEIAEEKARAEARAAAEQAKSNADIIESDAKREADLKKIENEKLTRNQEIEKDRILEIQKEEAKQKIYIAEKETKANELAVKQLEEEKNAEIAKNIELIKADEQKQKTIIDTEAEKTKIELQAQADKTKVELEAEAEKNKIESIWLAKAKEIDYIWSAQAKNKEEMAKALNMFTSAAFDYMKKELDIQVAEKVDLEKAKALWRADVKVISTWKDWWEWINSFMDLFSAKGWTSIWAMIEAAKNTIWEDKVNDFISKFSQNKKDIQSTKQTIEKVDNTSKKDENQKV